jgi:hypothetical protein
MSGGYLLKESDWKLVKIKKKYKEYDFEGRYQEVERMKRPMTISGKVIGEIEIFKYLG